MSETPTNIAESIRALKSRAVAAIQSGYYNNLKDTANKANIYYDQCSKQEAQLADLQKKSTEISNTWCIEVLGKLPKWVFGCNKLVYPTEGLLYTNSILGARVVSNEYINRVARLPSWATLPTPSLSDMPLVPCQVIDTDNAVAECKRNIEEFKKNYEEELQTFETLMELINSKKQDQPAVVEQQAQPLVFASQSTTVKKTEEKTPKEKLVF